MPLPLEVFLLFLKFGFIAFGGPLAHVAMFEEEFVRKRGWITRERFLERMSLMQLIPGPNSTELTMQIGYARAGWPGFFLAGLGFLLPAVIMVAALGEIYLRFGGFASVGRWVWGTMPVVAALIVVMLYHSLRTTLKPSWRLLPIALGFALYCYGFAALTALCATAALWNAFRRDPVPAAAFLVGAALPFLPVSLGPAVSTVPTVPALFAQMFYLGSIVIGSGYVLFSYFSSQLVAALHWVNPEVVALAIAAGQLTPGPLFSSATFFGQVLHGWAGASACALGIFAPAFLFSGISIPLSARLEKSPWWKESLQVMASVSVLMLARETFRLAPTFLDGPLAYAFFAVAFVAHLRFRVNTAVLVLLGALAGAFLR